MPLKPLDSAMMRAAVRGKGCASPHAVGALPLTVHLSPWGTGVPRGREAADAEATPEELARRYRELFESLQATGPAVQRGWKHLELAKLALVANDLDIALWHLEMAAMTACINRNAELLAAVRKVRLGMGPWTAVHPEAFVLDRVLTETVHSRWAKQENPQQDNRNGRSR
jgi:hypothetical protein